MAWEQYLEKIYFNLFHPGSFKGANKLHEAIKDEGKYTISLSKVKNKIKNHSVFTSHCIELFCHLKVIVGGLNDQYEADLADFYSSL